MHAKSLQVRVFIDSLNKHKALILGNYLSNKRTLIWSNFISIKSKISKSVFDALQVFWHCLLPDDF